MFGCRFVRLVAAEHAADLGDNLFALQSLDLRFRLGGGNVLFEPEVSVGERGDLRQVGNADDLAVMAQRPQPLANYPSGVAADPGATVFPFL